MTAPTAPRIIAHSDGEAIYVKWRLVPDAIEYKVYIDDHADPTTVVDVVLAEDETEGWLRSITASYAGPNWVAVTALNAGEEESDPSNAVALNLKGPGVNISPTPARRKAVKSSQ